MATVNLGRVKTVFRGAYSAAVVYKPLDFLKWNGLTYFCIVSAPAGTLPSNGSYFELVAPPGDPEVTAGNVAAALGYVPAGYIQSYFLRSTRMTGGNNSSVGDYAASSNAVQRRMLTIPSMQLDVGGVSLALGAAVLKDLNAAASWDVSTYATASARAGKDFNVFACVPAVGAVPDFVVSLNDTLPSALPSGSTPSVVNTRKIGGLHCFCLSAGTLSGHDLSGYLTGDILPRSVWDLDHRPVCAPKGIVYDYDGLWKWIYLPSVSGGELVSAFTGVVADGVSAQAFHARKFDQWFSRIGCRTISEVEFVSCSIGSNQGTNISGSSDPNTTGGHSDTVGRRMVSRIGCEDCCGVYYQWGRDQGALPGVSSWINAFTAEDSGVAGQSYAAPTRPLFGGGWNDGAGCGSRSSLWDGAPLALGSYCSSRGVAEPASAR